MESLPMKLWHMFCNQPWFQGVGMRTDAQSKAFIKLSVNVRLTEQEINKIPVNVEGVPVRIFYKPFFGLLNGRNK